MKNFNLSTWALAHSSMIAFLMLILAIGGAISYRQLGRAEDPTFTIKVMLVRAYWPGATAQEVDQQVTDRIEKKLQELPLLDNLRSFSKPGESVTFVELRDYTPPKKVPELFYQVRKKLDDIRHTLPEGVQGPYANDEFGDSFGIIYALTGAEYSHADLRRQADRLAYALRRVPDVAKVDLVGVQAERVWIETSAVRLASLGLDPEMIAQAVREQNAVTPAGTVETTADRVRLQVTGGLDAAEAVRALAIRAGGHTFRLGDIAEVRRGYADPAQPIFRWQGQPAVGLALSMTKGGDILALGERLKAETTHLTAGFPVGMKLHQAADQPEVVRQNINEFMQSLAEAIAIVLAVSFLALGWRPGLVVAIAIPLVLATVFVAMRLLDIDMQRISLGALIIALGLLVDDAIIAVEMMVIKLEQGWDKARAAAFAYTSTAFPMLTGTLITATGFLPVGFAKSAAGEYTFSIFAIVGIALIASWVVAVVFTPWLGVRLLNRDKLMAIAARHGGDPYATPLYRRFRGIVAWCVAHRWRVIGVTLVVFILALVGFAKGVEKQFFPSSKRPELLVDLWLPQAASFTATEAVVTQLEAVLANDTEIQSRVRHSVSYIGMGSVRFYLPLDPQMPHHNFAQLVVMTNDTEAREVVKRRIEGHLAQAFSAVKGRVTRLENGPPVGYPVAFRVVGDDPERLRQIAAQVMTVMRAHPYAHDVNLDWNDLIKQVRIEVDQDKARALGLSSQAVSRQVALLLQGQALTRMREADQLIDVVLRAQTADRLDPARLGDLQIHIKEGRFVPLAQIATLKPELADGIIWRRDRKVAITVRCDLKPGIQAPTVTAQINPQLAAIRQQLPDGYRIDVGGTAEKSGAAEKSVQAVFPFAIMMVLFLLMAQLQSARRTILVVLTAPLGLIGVTLSLLAFNAPFGFVAQLGVIALFGMIMRNSVILVDQIEQDIAAGKVAWEAIIDSTVRRARPILLTALAAILAMIPLSRSIFWGPMAIAIMGGLLVATVLTLLVLPALYAAWFKVKPVPLDA